ncbi:MAG: hypothetical protein ETSY1_07355 [Candidatus Entotheonella factor]|uniref:Transposase DDE domain-containing protein n=1 Tax=Entotheonella factor TaxID=1429438 RepID=W4LUQ9_ENTF1|nr:MAG: hypothetical protein ETSY1_07355 [Candidatus Entotheonella factor]
MRKNRLRLPSEHRRLRSTSLALAAIYRAFRHLAESNIMVDFENRHRLSSFAFHNLFMQNLRLGIFRRIRTIKITLCKQIQHLWHARIKDQPQPSLRQMIYPNVDG